MDISLTLILIAKNALTIINVRLSSKITVYVYSVFRVSIKLLLVISNFNVMIVVLLVCLDPKVIISVNNAIMVVISVWGH